MALDNIFFMIGIMSGIFVAYLIIRIPLYCLALALLFCVGLGFFASLVCFIGVAICLPLKACAIAAALTWSFLFVLMILEHRGLS